MNNNQSQFFSSREEIDQWLDENYVKNYTINDDLSVNVNGDVYIFNRKLKTIPIKFGNVTGDFGCHYNQLVSLVGAPKTVGGNFDCSYNKLTSLNGAPKIMNGYFSCVNNPLTSLIEIIDCNFKENIYFNIDEKNFKQKALIKTLEEYCGSENKCYELTNNQFHGIIKSHIEKELLQQKLIDSKIKNKTRTSFL